MASKRYSLPLPKVGTVRKTVGAAWTDGIAGLWQRQLMIDPVTGEIIDRKELAEALPGQADLLLSLTVREKTRVLLATRPKCHGSPLP
jgi:hypothetical protein